MKILCVHQAAELYGSDRSFALTIKALRGHYPDAEIVVVLPKSGPLEELIEPLVNCIEIRDIGTMQRSDIKKPIQTIKRLGVAIFHAIKHMTKYDVVYINTIVVFAYMIGAIFTKKLVINHIREIPSKKESLVFSLLFRFNRAHLIFNSNYSLNSYSYIKSARSHVVLNGLKALDRNVKFELSQTFNILVIGRIHINKGQLLAIEAIKLLITQYPHIRLRIVGSPVNGQEWQVKKLEEAIIFNKLEEVVEFIPFDSNPLRHFTWSTISLIPSIKPESFGRVAIESFSIGRPVVATKLGGLAEIIKNNVGGYLFNCNDKNDLAAKISLFLNDESLLYEKSEEAYQSFEDNFSEDIYINNFCSTFDKLLNQAKL